MKPSTDINIIFAYAKDTPIPAGDQPTEEDINKGVSPLDPLPAQWWNYYWNIITTNYSKVASYTMSLGNEIVNLLKAANMKPSETEQDQVLRAVRYLSRVIATSDVPGAVKSSSDSGNVSVNPGTGIMTANGMGDTANLNTSLKTTLVDAINEVITKLSQQNTDLRSYIDEKQLKIRIGAPTNPQPGDIWLEEA